MADITGLLAELRGEQPPATPYDPAAARRAARNLAAQDREANPEASTERQPGDDPREATST
jgi:hypothetical protein